MQLDKDGLLRTKDVMEQHGRFFYGEAELFVAPECREVIEYLLKDEYLWSVARLRFNVSDIRQKRAPIIGVPFSHALRRALLNSDGLQKSLFEVPDWTIYQGKAVVATMLAHTSATPTSIEFQAWQFLDVSDETFYVHCILEKKSGVVTHFDAATILHTDVQRAQIRNHACKIKGSSYSKHFRLDGRISVSVVTQLMELYFPVEPLTQEFLNALQ